MAIPKLAKAAKRFYFAKGDLVDYSVKGDERCIPQARIEGGECSL